MQFLGSSKQSFIQFIFSGVINRVVVNVVDTLVSIIELHLLLVHSSLLYFLRHLQVENLSDSHGLNLINVDFIKRVRTDYNVRVGDL